MQWHALSREEQAKYYELARKERQLHMQLYPGWSARDNYVSGVAPRVPAEMPPKWPKNDLGGLKSVPANVPVVPANAVSGGVVCVEMQQCLEHPRAAQHGTGTVWML